MPTLRAFLAIPLGCGALETITSLRNELIPLAPGVRWVAPENIHLTVRFFGDIASREVDKIAVVMLSLRTELETFKSGISGLDAFPSLSRPRVLWLGLQNQNAAKKLYSRVEKGLAAVGMETETRPFTPHLTLGRIKQPLPSAGRLLKKFRHVYCGEMTADRLVLFESRLNPKGAVHLPLFSLTLGESLPEDQEND